MGVKHIEKVKELRHNGWTFEKIGNELGLSRQQIWYTAKMAGIAGKQCGIDSVIYTGVRKWLAKENIRLNEFCEMCGEDYGSGSVTHRFLIGKSNGNMNVIKSILSVCNLTFEEAFGEVDNESN